SSSSAPAMAVASCATRRSPTNALPSEVSRLVVVPTALSSTLSRVPGSLVCTRPARMILKGATDTNGWLADFATSMARLTAVRGVGNDLHRRHQLAGLDAGEGRQRGDCHRLVELVQRIDALMIDDGEAGLAREVVAAAGEGRRDLDALAGQRARDRGGGFVLVHVVGIEAGGDHRRGARGPEPGPILLPQHPPPGASHPPRAPPGPPRGPRRPVAGRFA